MSKILYDHKLCPLYAGNTCSELDKEYQRGREDAINELTLYLLYDKGYINSDDEKYIKEKLKEKK